MKIEKLPSGAYRLRKTKNKKVYTVIVDYKPTAREAEQLMFNHMNNIREESSLTLGEAMTEYANLKKNVLSPSTLKDYVKMPNRFSKDFIELNIEQITQIDVQKEINLLAKTTSPKTVKNYHGYISAVLGEFRPDFVLRTTLPKGLDKEMHIPTDDEVRAILKASEGTDYEIAMKLSCYGLRRSEICCITAADLQGNLLTINKAVVSDPEGNWVKKMTKNVTSARDIYINDALADLIREKGKAFKYTPNSLTRYVTRTCHELGIEPFHLHCMRHYFVSTLADQGISDENIIKLSGHKTDDIMKRVYRHAKNVEEAKKEAAKSIDSILF